MISSTKNAAPKNMVVKNLILIALVILIASVPLFILKDAEFSGADAQAEAAISEIKPDYEPWFSPILEPKSGEIESLMFALQAAIGAGVLGYGIGFMKGRNRKAENT